MKSCKKKGGRAKKESGGATAYAGGESNVVKEAKERKKGGRDAGGRFAKASGGRIKKASGGRSGSDKSPLSSAAKMSARSDSTSH